MSIETEASAQWRMRFGEQHGPWMEGEPDQRRAAYRPPGEVPANLLGITDPDQLSDAHRILAESGAIGLGLRGQPSSFDFNGLAQINEAMLSNLYGWAGQARTIDLRPQNMPDAVPWQEAPFAVDRVADNIADANAYLGSSPSEAAPELARVYAALVDASPFRGGNQEAARALVSVVATEAGHDLHWARSHHQDQHLALLDALAYKRHDALTDQFELLLDPARPIGAPQERPSMSAALGIAFPPLTGGPQPGDRSTPARDPSQRPNLRLLDGGGQTPRRR